ncbi:MAG TPA: phasin family protein [Rhizomicrobium sp.]|jgi:phasin family protein
MAKNTKTTDKVTDTAETAVNNGAAAFKNGFEKAAKGYDHFLTYGKDTAEAYLKAANVAGKGLETLHHEIYGFSKQSIEDSLAATKAVLGSKSVHEAFEVQTDFAKTAFDAYVGQMTRLSQIVTATSKEAFAPLQSRVQAWVDVVNSSRAA